MSCLGEMIRAQKETVGLAQGKRTDLVPEGNQVGKATLSSRGQKLAAMPEDNFYILSERLR